MAYAEECRELRAIKGGTDTIREMGRLVVEGGSLIDECMRHGFLREFFLRGHDGKRVKVVDNCNTSESSEICF